MKTSMDATRNDHEMLYILQKQYNYSNKHEHPRPQEAIAVISKQALLSIEVISKTKIK